MSCKQELNDFLKLICFCINRSSDGIFKPYNSPFGTNSADGLAKHTQDGTRLEMSENIPGNSTTTDDLPRPPSVTAGNSGSENNKSVVAAPSEQLGGL